MNCCCCLNNKAASCTGRNASSPWSCQKSTAARHTEQSKKQLTQLDSDRPHRGPRREREGVCNVYQWRCTKFKSGRKTQAAVDQSFNSLSAGGGRLGQQGGPLVCVCVCSVRAQLLRNCFIPCFFLERSDWSLPTTGRRSYPSRTIDFQTNFQEKMTNNFKQLQIINL